MRLADMDADGVDMQVVSPTPVFFSYDRPGAEAAKVARIFNDLALEICAPAPRRLVPFCQVPLQDPDAACAELDRCLAAGHAGVEIGNHVGDRDLDDEGIVTFLQHCADARRPGLRAPVGHGRARPGSTGGWRSGWPACRPRRTCRSSRWSSAASSTGCRESLRICFAHGGGSFAFWLGPLRERLAPAPRPDRRRREHPPSAYLGRFQRRHASCSTERALRLLVDTLGADQVMVGSDYPYPLGERPVGGVVRTRRLPRRRTSETPILRGNAERFLATPVPIDRHDRRTPWLKTPPATARSPSRSGDAT